MTAQHCLESVDSAMRCLIVIRTHLVQGRAVLYKDLKSIESIDMDLGWIIIMQSFIAFRDTKSYW